MSAPVPDAEVIFDESRQYPVLGSLVRAMDAGLAAALPPFRALDPLTRAFVTPRLGPLLTAAERDVDDRDLTDPDHALLVASARSAAGVRALGDDDVTTARDHLVRAERLLVRLVAARPTDSGAWALRLRTARRLDLGQSEVRRRSDRLAELIPYQLDPQYEAWRAIRSQTDTFDAAFDIVKEWLRAAPPGSPVHALVAFAHLEEAWRQPQATFGQIVSRPAVIRDVDTAARLSIWHPTFVNGLDWVRARSAFALIFLLQGRNVDSRNQFAALGPYGCAQPFDLLQGGAKEWFGRARLEASWNASRPTR